MYSHLHMWVITKEPKDFFYILLVPRGAHFHDRNFNRRFYFFPHSWVIHLEIIFVLVARYLFHFILINFEAPQNCCKLKASVCKSLDEGGIRGGGGRHFICLLRQTPKFLPIVTRKRVFVGLQLSRKIAGNCLKLSHVRFFLPQMWASNSECVSRAASL
jgi:hypothetical protein